MSDEEKAPTTLGLFAYNVRDVALLTRTNETLVRQAVVDGDLTPSYPHSDARFTPEAVKAWVASWPPTPRTPRR